MPGGGRLYRRPGPAPAPRPAPASRALPAAETHPSPRLPPAVLPLSPARLTRPGLSAAGTRRSRRLLRKPL